MTTTPIATSESAEEGAVATKLSSRSMIDAPKFRSLMVSHRRMIRADDAESHLRGLQDLDTGETFLVDERRLHEVSKKR